MGYYLTIEPFHLPCTEDNMEEAVNKLTMVYIMCDSLAYDTIITNGTDKQNNEYRNMFTDPSIFIVKHRSQIIEDMKKRWINSGHMSGTPFTIIDKESATFLDILLNYAIDRGEMGYKFLYEFDTNGFLDLDDYNDKFPLLEVLELAVAMVASPGHEEEIYLIGEDNEPYGVICGKDFDGRPYIKTLEKVERIYGDKKYDIYNI